MTPLQLPERFLQKNRSSSSILMCSCHVNYRSSKKYVVFCRTGCTTLSHCAQHSMTWRTGSTATRKKQALLQSHPSSPRKTFRGVSVVP